MWKLDKEGRNKIMAQGYLCAASALAVILIYRFIKKIKDE